VVARSVAETIGLTTDDEAGLVYVSILGGEIRMVLMSHDCSVAQLQTPPQSLTNRLRCNNSHSCRDIGRLSSDTTLPQASVCRRTTPA
jgi:hypothetical protein